MSKLILFGGKGGVGKTTTSAAIAIWTASQGFNTLVVSSDPAHSLGDSFGLSIGNTPTQVGEIKNLWAVEMDPRQTMNEFAPRITETLTNPLKSLGINEDLELSGDDMIFPGLDEALAFDFLLRAVESQEYDVVIFDTAPTGHTLRFLSLPSLTDRWITKMIRFRDHLTKLKSFFRQKKDTSLEILEQFKKRVEHIQRFLVNEKFTSFYLVVIPEMLAVEESRRAKAVLEKYGIPVKGAVINNIVPENTECRLCQSRRRSQSRHLQSIKEEFVGLELAEVPLFDMEIQGIEALRLFGEKVLGEEKLDIRVQKSLEKEYDSTNGVFRVHMFYPETHKSDLKLKIKRNILNITLYGVTTQIEVPFTIDSKKVMAEFQDDYLHITVEQELSAKGDRFE